MSATTPTQLVLSCAYLFFSDPLLLFLLAGLRLQALCDDIHRLKTIPGPDPHLRIETTLRRDKIRTRTAQIPTRLRVLLAMTVRSLRTCTLGMCRGNYRTSLLLLGPTDVL